VRRPVLLLCLAEAAGIFSAYYLNYASFIIFLCFCTLYFIFCRPFRGLPKELRGIIAAALLFFLLGLMLMLHSVLAVTASGQRAGLVSQFDGIAVSAHQKENYAAIVVRTDRIDGGPAREKVLLKLESGDADVYDIVGRRVSFKGEVSLPEGRRNPGCFDYRRYLRARGIRAVPKVP